jgi:Leucine-rich repeat (LRR) protein
MTEDDARALKDFSPRAMSSEDCKDLVSEITKGVFHNLEILNVRENNIDDECVNGLATSIGNGGLQSLLELDVSGNAFSKDGAASLFSQMSGGKLAKLTTFRMMDMPDVGDAAAGMLAAATSGVPDLKTLTFVSSRVTGEGLTLLASALEGGALPNLESLYLHMNRIDDTGLSSLAGAISKGALSKMSQLFLGSNSFGNVGSAALFDAIKVRGLPKLKLLNLFGAVALQAGSAGLKSLTGAVESGSLPSLKTINLLHMKGKARDRELAAACRTRRIEINW